MRLILAIILILSGFGLAITTILLLATRSHDSILAYTLKGQRCYVAVESHTCTRQMDTEGLSPDGQWQAVAFRSTSRDLNRLFQLIKRDTKNGAEQPLFSNHHPIHEMSWSPDGKFISFSTEDPLGRSSVYVVTHQGNMAFLGFGFGVAHAPSWSPTGEWLAFHLRGNPPGLENIYKMRPDGSERQQLTFHRGSDYAPIWSPDGTWIAFVSNRDDNAEIYKIRADGSAETRLTHLAGADIAPSWSPDGEWIGFLSTQGSQQYVYQMGQDGSHLTRLMRVPHEVRRVEWVETGNLGVLPLIMGIGLFSIEFLWAKMAHLIPSRRNEQAIRIPHPSPPHRNREGTDGRGSWR